MKAAYRSRSRLIMDLLGALDREGPVGVRRLLLVANLTHGTLQELLSSFEQNGWAQAAKENDQSLWTLTETGTVVLAELRRVDAAMRDLGLGL